MQDEFKISHYDLFISLIISIIGIKSFSYPREMANLVGTDGWFVTIISGIVIYLIVRVIKLFLVSLFPFQNYSE